MAEDLVLRPVNTANDGEGAFNPPPPPPPAVDDVIPTLLLSPPSMTVETAPVTKDDARWDWNTKVFWRQKWKTLSYEKQGAQSTKM